MSQKEAMICLLDKKGKDRRIINNLRPITLSNCDLKLITKTYTTRINKILSRIISPNQTAYVPGRQVHDGLRLLDIYRNHHYNHTEGYIISLDAKKAYDSVSHDYIDHVLDARGFSSKFRYVFKTLYNNITTKVMVNGYATEPIHIKRGVKQGDALSCSLFILVMDQIINDINQKLENKVTINGNVLTNVVAYADDLAVVTTKKEDIQKVIRTYEEFSHESGLYLNADKTEILNIKKWSPNETIEIDAYGQRVTIKMMEEIKICGKLFTLNSNLISNHIEGLLSKATNQMKAWNKRRLSTDGHILVSKTFGISQIIYHLQNTFLNPEQLKKLESIVYNFIWNGPDKIKRDTIKKDFDEGGLKGPCIELLDKTLKLKQVARGSHSIHPIQLAQQCLPIGTSLVLKTSNKDPFTNKGIETYNQMAINTFKEFIHNPFTNVHRDYINIITKTPVWVFQNTLKGENKIKEMIIKRECGLSGIFSIKDALANPDPPFNIKSVTSVIHQEIAEKISRHHSEPQPLSSGICKVPIKLNIFRDIRKLKHRELFTSEPRPDPDEITPTCLNPFARTRKIQHPKERVAQFMALHKKTYTNEKLHRLKMIGSDQCAVCNVVEDRKHMFHECTRAVTAWSVYKEVSGENINEVIIDVGFSS
jgi:hypothetical protein